MSRTDPPRMPTSPQDVGGKHFTIRLRGLDHDEVRYFLAGLADQLERIQAQVATLTQGNDTLTRNLRGRGLRPLGHPRLHLARTSDCDLPGAELGRDRRSLTEPWTAT
jgi:DivIVA domain-containing protein